MHHKNTKTMETNNTPATKKMNPKRAALILASEKARTIRENLKKTASTAEGALYWAGRTINFILLNFVYEQEGVTEYKTFNEWKEEGATIRKGAKATVVWGQPRKGTPAITEEELATLTESERIARQYEFFPLAFLFSNLDVVRPNQRTEAGTETEEAYIPEPTICATIEIDGSILD